MATDQLTNKALEQVDFNIHHSGNVSGSGEGPSDRSIVTCYKCSKKRNIHK